MSKTGKKDIKSNVTHTTRIGNVTGQVHTGSGDIIVKSFSTSGSIGNKNDFIAAMQQLKDELEFAHQKGLNEDTTDDTLSEIEAAEREAQKENPVADRILKRLKQAQEILTASAKVATISTTAVAAINNLLPLLENAVQTVGRVFLK